MAKEGTEEVEEETKKGSSLGFIVAFVLATVMSLGSGWFIGGTLIGTGGDKKVEMKKPVEEEAEKDQAKNSDADGSDEGEEEKSLRNIIMLEPVLVLLRESKNTFIRLELAIVLNEDEPAFDTESLTRLKSDISDYSRTLSLQQIQGPSGYLHFRDDLLDRVRLTTDGKVRDVLVLSMVAE